MKKQIKTSRSTLRMELRCIKAQLIQLQAKQEDQKRILRPRWLIELCLNLLRFMVTLIVPEAVNMGNSGSNLIPLISKNGRKDLN